MSSGELSLESPPFLRVTWTIPDFVRLYRESAYYLQSPDFTFADDRYCLRLSHAYITVELVNFIDTVTRGDVWYEVQLKLRTEEIDISSHLYDKKLVSISLNALERQRYQYVPDGTLTVLCSVRLRKPSSAGNPMSSGAQTRVIPKYTMSGTLSFESLPLLSVVWRIPGFFKLARNFRYSLESPEFIFSDGRYCLQLFSSEDGVEIKLANLNDIVPGRFVPYNIGLKSTSGEEFFKQSRRKVNFCISRSELDASRFSDDHLVVFCSTLSREPSIEESPKSGGAETPGSKAPIPQAAAHPKSSGTGTQVFPGLKIVPQAATHPKSGGAETSSEEKDKERLPGVSKLVSDLKKLLKKVPDSDACLVVCGKEFRAHQIILRARSTVFDAMFGHDTAEKESGRVVLDDLDPDIFGDFLEYLYTGSVGAGLSDDNVFGLYKAADKYDVPTLKAECVAHMHRSLSVNSFCDVLALALRHKEEDLLSRVVLFFKENMARIIVTVKWQQFVIDNGTIANELLIKAVVPPGQ